MRSFKKLRGILNLLIFMLIKFAQETVTISQDFALRYLEVEINQKILEFIKNEPLFSKIH